jgi:hypothetical protein
MDGAGAIGIGRGFSYAAQGVNSPLRKYEGQRITARVNLHNGSGLYELGSVTPKRSLSARAVCVSKTIDIITVTVSITGPIVFAALNWAFRADPKVISILNYVLIGVSALLALGPLKSKILDILKRPE